MIWTGHRRRKMSLSKGLAAEKRFGREMLLKRVAVEDVVVQVRKLELDALQQRLWTMAWTFWGYKFMSLFLWVCAGHDANS